MTAPPLALQVALAAFVLGFIAILMGRAGSFAWCMILSMAALLEFLAEEDEG